MGPRTGLDASEEKRSLALPGFEPRSVQTVALFTALTADEYVFGNKAATRQDYGVQ